MGCLEQRSVLIDEHDLQPFCDAKAYLKMTIKTGQVHIAVPSQRKV